MVKMTRISHLFIMFFLLSMAPLVVSFINGGTYTISYPAASAYLCPAAGSNISYVATPTPLVVTQAGTNYSLAYNEVTFSSWPASYYVEAPAVPGSGQYFVMTPVVTSSTTALASGSSVNVSQGNYSGFPWKTINSSSSFTLNFTANVPTTDLIIGLRYSVTNCVEIVLGGWFNSKSVVRDIDYSAGIRLINEYPVTSSAPPIAQLNSAIKYVLTIANGTLTIVGTLPSGAAYTALTYTSSYLNKIFTGYSFRGCPPYAWTVSADSVSAASSSATSATTSSLQAIKDGYYWIQYSSAYPQYYADVGMSWTLTKPASPNMFIQYNSSTGNYNLTFASTGAALGAFAANSTTSFVGCPWILVFGSTAGSSTTTATFTCVYSGYYATSTISQADANAKALALWSSAVVTSITNAKNTALSAFNTVNTALSAQLTALNAARNALKDVAVNIGGFTNSLPWE